MGNAYSEDALQKNVATYLHSAMPDDVPWTALESSGRGSRDGARQRAKGVNPGWADLQFIVEDGKYLGIELKRPAVPHIRQRAGKQQPIQKENQAAVTGAGGYYYLATSICEVEAILRSHGVALTARAL